MTNWTVVCDDVIHWAETYSGPPFHAILTDPPYELGFMGKSWDASGVAFQPATWAALTAHLLPGAHVLAFGGGRTHHRLMCAIEDAGLEIRDCIYWAFGSGFPKSLNVGKAIDKAAGAEREVVGEGVFATRRPRANHDKQGLTFADDSYVRPAGHALTAPTTPAAATWEGYGTALKPAVEVIVMARKPIEGTIAGNCERYGSGALAIDACRIMTGDDTGRKTGQLFGGMDTPGGIIGGETIAHSAGRWPANLILDDSEAVAGLFPVTHNGGKAGRAYKQTQMGMYTPGEDQVSEFFSDSGSAARFFYQATWEPNQAEQLDAADVLRYCAKASRAEREVGLDSLPLVQSYTHNADGRDMSNPKNAIGDAERRRVERGEPGVTLRHNPHPTVKPLSLCRYLATLLLPPAAYAPRRILVPFGGVASEAIGAGLAGWDEIVMVESEREYCDIAEARLAYWLRQPELALR